MAKRDQLNWHESILQKIQEDQACLQKLVTLQHRELLQKLESDSSSFRQSAAYIDDACADVQLVFNAGKDTDNFPKQSQQTLVENCGDTDMQEDNSAYEVLETATEKMEKNPADGDKERKEEQGDEHSSNSSKDEEMEFMNSLKSERPRTYAAKFRRFVVSPYFEIGMGVMIIANAFLSAVQSQFRGEYVGYNFAVREKEGGWLSVKDALEAGSIFFNGLYLVELLVRIWALGIRFFKSWINIFDGLVVIGSIFLDVQSHALEIPGLNLSSLRLVRVFRIFRLVKLIRYAHHVHEMHVLVHALQVAVRGILWSMLLLFGVISVGAIIILQLAYPYLEDESIKLEHRLWLYNNFGTTTRAMWTMFECTFTGGWRIYSRYIIENINTPIFASFWVIYVLGVNFMVMKVVGSLFLKNTLQVAAQDEERIKKHRRKEKEHFFAHTMKAIFSKIDASGDGAISRAEWDRMLHMQDNIVDAFKDLDLEMDEVNALFDCLCADDGVADYEEFLEGVLRMKNTARAMDAIHILHVALSTQKTVERSMSHLKRMSVNTGVGFGSLDTSSSLSLESISSLFDSKLRPLKQSLQAQRKMMEKMTSTSMDDLALVYDVYGTELGI